MKSGGFTLPLQKKIHRACVVWISNMYLNWIKELEVKTFSPFFCAALRPRHSAFFVLSFALTRRLVNPYKHKHMYLRVHILHVGTYLCRYLDDFVRDFVAFQWLPSCNPCTRVMDFFSLWDQLGNQDIYKIGSEIQNLNADLGLFEHHVHFCARHGASERARQTFSQLWLHG